MGDPVSIPKYRMNKKDIIGLLLRCYNTVF